MIEETIQISQSVNFNWRTEEILAVFFGITYVILAAKENIWCWPASAISCSLYIYINYTENLPAIAALNLFYLIMAIYGYFMWKKGGVTKIKEWSTLTHAIIISFGTIALLIIAGYLIYTNASQEPLLDALTAVFSIIATYMITKKVVENWLYWIIIDIVFTYLYLSIELYLTAMLCISYTIIAIIGYFSWIKKMNND